MRRITRWLTLVVLAGCTAPQAPPDQQKKKSAPAPEALAKTSMSRSARPAAMSAKGEAADPDELEIVWTGGDSKGDDSPYCVMHLEFTDAEACAAFHPEHVYPFNRFEKWADAYVASQNVWTLSQAKGLVWCDQSCDSIVPPPHVSRPAASRGKAEEIVRGGLGGLTGKGVIVAVIDSGCDFRHPDFITYDEEGKPTSRLLYLWDTTSDAFETQGIGAKAPVAYPNGASVGTVYTREQLTADLRAAEPRIGGTDANGHGTACAGLAAGNGNAEKRYCGVAPDADIIAVRIGGTEAGNLENAYLMNAACGWIDSVADGHPYVVSCSFGGHYPSGHDGAMVIERQLDARFPSEAKGRAICIAAGNEAQSSLHGQTSFSAKGSGGEIQWQANKDAEIRVYFGSSDRSDLGWEITGPSDTVKDVQVDERRHALTEQVFWIISSPPGEYTLRPYSRSGAQVEADAYIFGGKAPRFVGTCAAPRHQVGSPGTASEAITVGSYDFNDEARTGAGTITLGTGDAEMTIGAISSYSNPGPRRVDAITKPEVTAPGQYHAACFPLNPCGLDQYCRRDPSGKYVVDFNGTSAATPYCAGVIALALQKNPGLSVGEIRTLLAHAAKADEYTGEVPNAVWGNGKLNLEAVEAFLESVPSE